VRALMRVRLLGCAAVLLLAGCHSSSPGTAAGSHGSGRTPGGARTVAASEPDNGDTITMAVGDMLVVMLHNTYWRFAALSQAAALRSTGPSSIVTSKVTGCVPGQGCGTVRESFRAVTAGRVVVTASRTSCGEARRCTGAAGSYRLAVVVG
jgi:hypothetical protein